MKSDTVEFWNDIWSRMDHTFADYDDLLVRHAEGLEPGRALELGCGSGGNAVWLAQRGWQVTAVDFSEVAIEKARERAAGQNCSVEFVVSDAIGYRPEGKFDLIISFYIQLWPQGRAQMLASAADSLAPGGRLLFVSHDQSSPPQGWSEEDLESLTTPEQVAAELPGLRIDRAETVLEAGAHSFHGPDSEEPEGLEEHHVLESAGQSGDEHAQHGHDHWATTVVLAVKDA